MSIATFLTDLQTILKSGTGTEHSYRPALKSLFERSLSAVMAQNEPKHEQYGAPDFVITRGSTPIGHVEAKNIGIKLESVIQESEKIKPKTQNAQQLRRYRTALPNLLYTDGLIWYWFRHGVLRTDEPVVLATWNSVTKKLTPTPTGIEDLSNLLNKFGNDTSSKITNPRELAERLARIAHWLRDVIQELFKEQTSQGSLHQQFEAFRKTLLPSLEPEQFADMYSQTIVYGLFAARVAQPINSTFSRFDAAQAIPKTNPFLRSLFQQIAGYDLDDRIAWLVDDCASLLAYTDMTEVMRDFGRATRQEDPVVHFYETFLAAYDPKMREARGVYYTPEPVVDFMVRAVHQVLQTEFNKPMGLADENTIILDPATGTATFLNTVIQKIYEELVNQGLAGTWDQYVPEKLLRRIFGFELLMAPYTIAHLKLGMLLKQLGYSFSSNQRLGVYLTNSLADAPSIQQSFAFAETIAAEGKAANDVKHNKQVMVVLGNPPYSGHSENTSIWIRNLLHGKLPNGSSSENYYEVNNKTLGERNTKWLQDDYVKFIRFGEWRISQSGEGVLTYISNNGYLDNPTFRGMRESLLKDFDTIYILNLHGNSKKREKSPDGSIDENVFDIQQGVAIGIFIKNQVNNKNLATVYYCDVWGSREEKYVNLINSELDSFEWQVIDPDFPWYSFSIKKELLNDEYNQFPVINSIFIENTVGFVTGQDAQTIAFSYNDAKKLARDLDISESYSKIMLYRPYDIRVVLYNKQVVTRPRTKVMKHMLQPNLGIATTRSIEIQSGFNHVFCTEYIMGLHAVSLKEGNYIFPLYIYPDLETIEPTLFEQQGLQQRRRANINISVINEFTQKLRLNWIDDGYGDLVKTFGPEDIFHYVYAIFHSLTYRQRYAEFLKGDFPRVPITSSRDLFKTLVTLGAQLVDLHLLRLPNMGGVGGAGGSTILVSPGKQGVSFPIGGNGIIDRVSYFPPLDDKMGEIQINATQKFVGITREVWKMQIGGYQPLEKWLKDRKGRALSSDEITRYLRIIIALRETQNLIQKIDAEIITWPIK